MWYKQSYRKRGPKKMKIEMEDTIMHASPLSTLSMSQQTGKGQRGGEGRRKNGRRINEQRLLGCRCV